MDEVINKGRPPTNFIATNYFVHFVQISNYITFLYPSVTSVSEIKFRGELLTYCVCSLFAELFKPHDYSEWPEVNLNL